MQRLQVGMKGGDFVVHIQSIGLCRKNHEGRHGSKEVS